MVSELDSHVKYPDRLKVLLDEAGVRYELIPLRQPGAFAVVAFLLETDDGCMDIEEQNEAAYQACLKIAQAALRFASSDLRGILRDEFVALRARAEAAEARIVELTTPDEAKPEPPRIIETWLSGAYGMNATVVVDGVAERVSLDTAHAILGRRFGNGLRYEVRGPLPAEMITLANGSADMTKGGSDV